MSRTVQETLLELREALRRLWVTPGTRRAAAKRKAVESTQRALDEDRKLEGDQLPVWRSGTTVAEQRDAVQAEEPVDPD